MKNDQIEAVARELVGDPQPPPKPTDRHINPDRKTVGERGLIVETHLVDQMLDDPTKNLSVRVEFRDGSIFIYPKGYGDYCSLEGKGCPAIIELADDRLRIVAWTDINQEDSTHTVEFDGAKEEERKPEPTGLTYEDDIQYHSS